MGRWTGKSCRLSSMLFLTASFFLIEIIVGYVTNSLALVADSFHMLSDVVALIVGLSSVKISKLKTKRNTYGWQRAEVLGALVNSVFLLALCFSILVESCKRLVEVEKVENPVMMLVVGGLGLVINLFGLCLFGAHAHAHGHSHGAEHEGHGHSNGAGHEGHSHDTGHKGKVKTKNHALGKTANGQCKILNGNLSDVTNGDVTNGNLANGDIGETKCLMASATNTDTVICTNNNDDRSCSISLEENENYTIEDNIDVEIEKPLPSGSLNMRGVFLHVMGDALGSIVVVISGLAIWLAEGNWKYYLDPALSLQIIGIMLYTTIPLFKETAFILLQTVPKHVSVETTISEILKIEGVTGVHECHIWQLSGSRLVGSAHVHCVDLKEYISLVSKIKYVFHLAGIHSTTIQLETERRPDGIQFCSLPCNANGKTCSELKCCSPGD